MKRLSWVQAIDVPVVVDPVEQAGDQILADRPVRGMCSHLTLDGVPNAAP
jgi:hypothetical protein